jgi:pyridoxamine 5'-phosphate oxidase
MIALSGEVAELLTEWLPANEDPARPLMQLATVDADGRPDVRTVLLSEWTSDGFYFHTDANSRKVVELRANAGAALDLLWPEKGRQLVIRGLAEAASPEEQAGAYARRSPYLRQLAWQNTPELAALDRDKRARRWAAFQAEHDVAEIAAPETWVGFLVRPDRLSFWLADPEAPSHRIEFTESADTWTRTDLPG